MAIAAAGAPADAAAQGAARVCQAPIRRRDPERGDTRGCGERYPIAWSGRRGRRRCTLLRHHQHRCSRCLSAVASGDSDGGAAASCRTRARGRCPSVARSRRRPSVAQARLPGQHQQQQWTDVVCADAVRLLFHDDDDVVCCCCCCCCRCHRDRVCALCGAWELLRARV